MATSIEQVFSARKPRGVAEVVVRARGPAPPEAIWALLATPGRWHEWAPHIARAIVDGGQADTIVAEGDHLTIHAPAGPALGATVTLVEPGGRWDFLVDLPGPYGLASAHAVRPAGAGGEVATRLRVNGPLAGVGGRAALLVYAPLARLALQRLVRLAAGRA